MSVSLIEVPAFFQVEEGDRTGVVVFSNGEVSRPLGSKRHARIFAHSQKTIGNLDEACLSALIASIDATNLPESDAELEDHLDEYAEVSDKVSSGCRVEI